jgi:hypothetical protein
MTNQPGRSPAPPIESLAQGRTAASSSAAWRRGTAAALRGLAFLAAALSLQACSAPAGGSSAAASDSGVQFYGTIDAGVGYEHVSN